MKQAFFSVFLLALFLVGGKVYAGDDYFRDRTNIVLFGGYHANQMNGYENGNYEGVYADYLAYKSDWSGLSVGPYLVMDRSAFVLNLLQYKSHSQEIGGGGVIGYYLPSFTPNNQMFAGLSIGVKYVDESAESLIKHGSKKGHYMGRQKDLMLASTLNFNLMKQEWTIHPELFSRTQVMIIGQLPVNSSKGSYWTKQVDTEIGDSLIATETWDKTYFQAIAKETVWRFELSENILCGLKATGGYFYSQGDANPSSFGFGAEIALAKLYKEDFLSVSGMYKITPKGVSDVFLWGINFNISSFFSKVNK